MLVRLLYASRAVDASPAAIEAILTQSRQHNPGSGITGILCYGGGVFLQAIEGGRSAVNELMIVGPLTVRSACSHHFCPVIGKIWIGIMPNEHTNVIGLSKYARLVDWIMGRPQIQEEAVVQLADLIMEKTQPDGLAVVMEASHFCMSWRGVREMDSKMINSVMRGVFLKDSALRREFLSLIPGRN